MRLRTSSSRFQTDRGDVTANQLPRKPVPHAMALCLLNWVIPGAGYIGVGDVARGVTLFILINATFATGVWMGGYILEPASWRPFTAEFNLVGILTYIVQAFHGGGWFLLDWLQDAAAADMGAFFNQKAQAVRTYSDLGVFHLITAGGLNYFATVRLYDLLAGTPEMSGENPAALDEAEEKATAEAES